MDTKLFDTYQAASEYAKSLARKGRFHRLTRAEDRWVVYQGHDESIGQSEIKCYGASDQHSANQHANNKETQVPEFASELFRTYIEQKNEERKSAEIDRSFDPEWSWVDKQVESLRNGHATSNGGEPAETEESNEPFSLEDLFCVPKRIPLVRSLLAEISQVRIYENNLLGGAIYWPFEHKDRYARVLFYLDDECLFRDVNLELFEENFHCVRVFPKAINKEFLNHICFYIKCVLQNLDEYSETLLTDSTFIRSFIHWAKNLFEDKVHDVSPIQIVEFVADIQHLEALSRGIVNPREEWEHSFLQVHLGNAAASSWREMLWRKYKAKMALLEARQMEAGVCNNTWEYDQVVTMYCFAATLGCTSAKSWLESETIALEIQCPEKVNMCFPKMRIRNVLPSSTQDEFGEE